MKIWNDRGKNSDLAGKQDISEISDSTGRYFFSLTEIRTPLADQASY
jgi:hypothetical protein